MAFDFATLLVTAASSSIAVVVGALQIRSTINNSRKENEHRVYSAIDEATIKVKAHVDEKINDISHRFERDERIIEDSEDDIENIEKDMKDMVKDFQTMCQKLSKQDYIITDLVPNFHELKDEFYKFKRAIETSSKKNNIVISNSEPDTNHDN
jgi:archaellum component FlaC